MKRRTLLRSLILGTALAFPMATLRLPKPQWEPESAREYSIGDLVAAMKQAGLIEDGAFEWEWDY